MGFRSGSERMGLGALVTIWSVGLLSTASGQVRWGQGQAGQGGGGGYNPGDEFPALGGGFQPRGQGQAQPSTNPGVDCRNETTGVFGPCVGPGTGPQLSTGFQAGVSSAFQTGGGQGYNPGSSGGQGYNPGGQGGQGYSPGGQGGQGYNPGGQGGQGYNPGRQGGSGYNPGWSGGSSQGGSSISSPDCDTLEQRIAELTREKTRLEAQRRSCPSSSSTSCR